MIMLHTRCVCVFAVREIRIGIKEKKLIIVIDKVFLGLLLRSYSYLRVASSSCLKNMDIFACAVRQLQSKGKPRVRVLNIGRVCVSKSTSPLYIY